MKVKTVKDLMLPLSEYATVSGEQTIRDAMLALDKAQNGLGQKKHHHRAVLVLDADGQVIGKLSHWAILRKLEPHILNKRQLSSISRANLNADYLDEMEESLSELWVDLSVLCKRAATVKAKDAMVQVGESIDQDESLVAAIHQLVVSHAQSLLVTHQGKTVGTLRLSDVFEAVAENIRTER